jgi:signal peptidase II
MNPVLKRYTYLILLAGLLVVLDQGTKWLAVIYLRPLDPTAVAWTEYIFGLNQLAGWIGPPVWTSPHPAGIKVLGDFFILKYTTNPGVAFGLNLGSVALNRIVFSAVTGVAIIVISIVVWKLTPRQKAHLMALAIILGGAVGNLIDRLRLGQVIDFLEFGVGTWRWPTFNLADAGITVGGISLIYLLIRGR